MLLCVTVDVTVGCYCVTVDVTVDVTVCYRNEQRERALNYLMLL